MLLALALAATPSPDELTLRYPGELRFAGDAASFHLLDRYGNEVPTGNALLLVGKEDAHEAFTQQRGLRIGMEAALLGVGSLSVLAGVGDPPDRTWEERLPQLAIGAAGLGGALAVHLAFPGQHLGSWVAREDAERVIAERNRAMATLSPDGDRVTPLPVALARQRQTLAPKLYRVATDDRVYDGIGHRITTPLLASVLSDERLLVQYDRRRRADESKWLTVTAVGSVVASAGAVTALVGIVRHYEAFGDPFASREADGVMIVGGCLGAAGMGVAGAGIGGGLIADAWRDEPAFWIPPDELRARLEAHNATVLSTLPTTPGTAPPPPPPERRPLPLPREGMRITPLLGPIIGLTGTF